MAAWRALMLLAFTIPASAAGPDTSRSYVFYLHGRIVEQAGPRPVSPEFGLYDYPAILDALTQRGAVVRSAQRPPDTDERKYAGEVTADIQRLLSAGVPASRISVVGFSKGGVIALHVSSLLRQPDIRYVIQAGCWNWLESAKDLQFTGHILSIIERSDTLTTSCSPYLRRSATLRDFREVEISTGKGHGAFFLPRPEWLEPTREWIFAR